MDDTAQSEVVQTVNRDQQEKETLNKLAHQTGQAIGLPEGTPVNIIPHQERLPNGVMIGHEVPQQPVNEGPAAQEDLTSIWRKFVEHQKGRGATASNNVLEILKEKVTAQNPEKLVKLVAGKK